MGSRPTLARESREFVDRTGLSAAFAAAVARVREGAPATIAFYGVGGVGKTRLRQELMRHLGDAYPQPLVGVLDFACADLRAPLQGLYALARVLTRDLPSDFPRFNAAHEAYWHSTHVEVRGSVDPLSAGVAGGASRAIDYADAAGVPALKLVRLLVGDAVTLLRKRKSRGIEEVQSLPAMEPAQILDVLPRLFGNDLNDLAARRGQPVVLVLDTYEALWEADRRQAVEHSRDEWIRDAIAASPSVLWTICGRERLTWQVADPEWAERLEQHLVGGLDEAFCEHFLQAAGVADEKVRSAIASASSGLPFYLDLASDTYFEMLERGVTPAPEDFAGTYAQTYERFIRYLSDEELLTLKLLACASRIDRDLFGHMLGRFETGYPRAAMTRLLRFSFFDVDDSAATMHELMRVHLQERLSAEDPELYHDVHRDLVDYALEELRGIDTRRQAADALRAFSLGYWSARAVMQPAELVQWYRAAFTDYQLGYLRGSMVDLARDLVAYAEDCEADPSTRAAATHILALALWGRRSTEEARVAAERALELDRQAGSPRPVDTARMLNTLGLVLQQAERYEEAEAPYRESLAIRRRDLEPDDPLVSRLMNNYAGILGLLDRAEEGLQLAFEALESRRRRLREPDPDIANSHSTIGYLRMHLGQFDASEQAFAEAIRQYGEVFGSDSMAVMSNRVALATMLLKARRPGDAEPLLRAALGVYEAAYGSTHPAVRNVEELLRTSRSESA